MCDERLFQHQTKTLSDAGYNCIVADFSNAASIQRIAEQSVKQVQGNFHVVGMSMGGIVAFEIYRKFNDRILSLALLNTTPLADKATNVRVETLKSVWKDGGLSVFAKSNAKNACIHKDQTGKIRNLVHDMAKDAGVNACIQQTLALMMRPSSNTTLPAISAPSLIIAGKQDVVCPPTLHDWMHDQIHNSQLITLDNCGHFSPLEQAEAVSTALLNFFRK